MAFDTAPLWLICVSVSAPIAAVVGFAVQLRTVRNLRLENQKLELEIESLERAKAEAERRIVIPTTDEVKEYAMFSRRTPERPLTRPQRLAKQLKLIMQALLEYVIFFLICAFLFYLLFDLYRLTLWLWGLF